MAVTTEIAPNVYRISIFVPPANLQFNHFLVKDAEPLLYHTGLRGMHAEIREAVSKIIDLAELRHISFSHFESDECGSHNEWLLGAQLRRDLRQVGARVNVNDFIGREASPTARLFPRENTASATARLPICRTAGTPACFSRQRRKRCSAPTCSTSSATWNR
jgi:hypothetical protein